MRLFFSLCKRLHEAQVTALIRNHLQFAIASMVLDGFCSSSLIRSVCFTINRKEKKNWACFLLLRTLSINCLFSAYILLPRTQSHDQRQLQGNLHFYFIFFMSVCMSSLVIGVLFLKTLRQLANLCWGKKILNKMPPRFGLHSLTFLTLNMGH